MSSLDTAITEIHSKSLVKAIEHSEREKTSYPFNKGLNAFFDNIKKKSVEFSFNVLDVFNIQFDSKGKVADNSEHSVKPSSLEDVLSNISGAVSHFKNDFLINKANKDIEKRKAHLEKKQPSRKSNIKPN